MNGLVLLDATNGMVAVDDDDEGASHHVPLDAGMTKRHHEMERGSLGAEDDDHFAFLPKREGDDSKSRYRFALEMLLASALHESIEQLRLDQCTCGSVVPAAGLFVATGCEAEVHQTLQKLWLYHPLVPPNEGSGTQRRNDPSLLPDEQILLVDFQLVTSTDGSKQRVHATHNATSVSESPEGRRFGDEPRQHSSVRRGA